MNIQVTDAWRITRDKYCWRVEQYVGVYKSGKHVGKTKYRIRGYFSDFTAATRKLAIFMLEDMDTTTILEALAGIRRVESELSKMLKKLEGRCNAVKFDG